MNAGWHLALAVDRPGFSLAVDLTLPMQGFTVMMGPSGVGKTSLLRAIAGLDPAARGRVSLDGVTWQDNGAGVAAARLNLAVHQRAVGMVFQDARLFPHLTVAQNLRFSRRAAKSDAPALDLSEPDLIRHLGLEALMDRRPAALSGGQQQRVALGRALLSRSRCLLLDEPLSALDLAARQSLLDLMATWRPRLRIPALHVTHAPRELLHLAHHAVWVGQAGTISAGIDDFLADVRIARHLGADAGSVLPAVVCGRDAGWHLAELDCAWSRWIVPDTGQVQGSPLRVFVRADDVSLSLRGGEAGSMRNDIAGTIDAIEADTHPALLLVRVRVGSFTVWSRLTRQAAGAMHLAPGQPVMARTKASALLQLPA